MFNSARPAVERRPELNGIPGSTREQTLRGAELIPLGEAGRVLLIHERLESTKSAVALLQAYGDVVNDGDSQQRLHVDVVGVKLRGVPRRRSTDAPSGIRSPDGRRLLVTDDYDAGLTIVDLASGERTTVDGRREGFSHISSAWSPDGDRVAFVGCKDNDTDCDVYVVGADGRNRRQVTHTPGIEFSLDWA